MVEKLRENNRDKVMTHDLPVKNIKTLPCPCPVRIYYGNVRGLVELY